MWKFEKQFRKDNPQTIGETDKHFDLDNYKDWLESKFEKYESALDKIANGTQPYNEREAFIFVDIAKQIASEALS